MTNNSFHRHNFTPTFPPVIEHAKNAYKQWLSIQRNLPQCERFGLGQKIDHLFIDLLDFLRKASFSSIPLKIPLLERSLETIDSLRFFIQYCWEAKLIPTKQFSLIGRGIETIGKSVGGWRKDLLKKTSAETEEKK